MNNDTEPHVIDAEWEAPSSERGPSPRRHSGTFGEKLSADGAKLEETAMRALDEIDSFQDALKDIWQRGVGVARRIAKDVRVGDRKPMSR